MSSKKKDSNFRILLWVANLIWIKVLINSWHKYPVTNEKLVWSHNKTKWSFSPITVSLVLTKFEMWYFEGINIYCCPADHILAFLFPSYLYFLLFSLCSLGYSFYNSATNNQQHLFSYIDKNHGPLQGYL